MKSTVTILLTVVFISSGAKANAPLESDNNYFAKVLGIPTKSETVDSCAFLVEERPKLVLRQSSSPQEDHRSNGIAWYKPIFMLPVLCDLICTKRYGQLTSTSIAPSWSSYIGGLILSSYDNEALPFLADVYIDPQVSSPRIEEEELLAKRRQVAFDLLEKLYYSTTSGGTDDRTFFRKQAEVYHAYARRMKALAERVDEATLSPVAVPDAPPTAPQGSLRRACEILLRLEAAPKTPFKAGEEAALVNELATLHQPVAATTLLGYLHQPLGGVDAKTIQQAVATLGEDAVPSVLRYLRTDKRTADEVRQALPILVALCKTPDATKERLLQAEQTSEHGARIFEANVVRMAN